MCHTVTVCAIRLLSPDLHKLLVFSADYYHHNVRSDQIACTADSIAMGDWHKWNLDLCKCVIRLLFVPSVYCDNTTTVTE